jgi:excinuclease ABC subunit A
VQLDNPPFTLSGGEAQRIKLASFLVKAQIKDKALFVFDEPQQVCIFMTSRNLLHLMHY